MELSRRLLLGLLAVPGVEGLAQQLPGVSNPGMSSRGIHPATRGKSSGRPFSARFTDVGRSAGLKAITLSGHDKRADYVIEAMGCGGCAVLLISDNDGWLDILVLTGSRTGDPLADASNRLYKNNRDGSFIVVSEFAGLFGCGFLYGVTVGDYDNDGFEDHVSDGLPAQRALSE